MIIYLPNVSDYFRYWHENCFRWNNLTDGFILPANTDDSHNLDAIILPDLTTEQEEALKESGYYGWVTSLNS